MNPQLGVPGVTMKLTFDQRVEAEALIPLIIDDPDAAAYEIVYWREMYAGGVPLGVDRLAFLIWSEHALKGERAPDLAIRSHAAGETPQ